MAKKSILKIKLTDKLAEDYKKYILKKHKAKIVNPKSRWRKSAARKFCKKLGIDTRDVDDFLNNYAFVIGRKVYCSFWKRLSPEQKIFLLTHEIQHVIDQRNEGKVKFLYRYYDDISYRVEQEAFAFLAEMELARWQLNTILRPNVLAAKLRSYRVGNKGIAYCERILTAYAPTVKSGHLVSGSGRDTIEFLKSYKG